GRERNDIISLDTRSYNNNAVGVDWVPSLRTRVSLQLEDRYYGNGHNVALEHRSGRMVYRYTDSRGVQNNPLQAGTTSMGSVFDLFGALYSSIEPDPIRRAQLVNFELQRLGLDPNQQILQDFLASSATLERMQRLSAAWVGVRTTVTFAL